MKYFITDSKSKEEKRTWNKLKVYCYDLRHTEDNWNEIYSIENMVIVNRYGCILTDEKINLGEDYPDDYIEFEEFKKNNQEVHSIEELKSNLENFGVIDLSDEEIIDYELLENIHLKKKEYKELKKKALKEQEKYICNYYHSKEDYLLIHKYDSVYQIIHLLGESHA